MTLHGRGEIAPVGMIAQERIPEAAGMRTFVGMQGLTPIVVAMGNPARPTAIRAGQDFKSFHVAILTLFTVVSKYIFIHILQ